MQGGVRRKGRWKAASFAGFTILRDTGLRAVTPCGVIADHWMGNGSLQLTALEQLREQTGSCGSSLQHQRGFMPPRYAFFESLHSVQSCRLPHEQSRAFHRFRDPFRCGVYSRQASKGHT